MARGLDAYWRERVRGGAHTECVPEPTMLAALFVTLWVATWLECLVAPPGFDTDLPVRLATTMRSHPRAALAEAFGGRG